MFWPFYTLLFCSISCICLDIVVYVDAYTLLPAADWVMSIAFSAYSRAYMQALLKVPLIHEYSWFLHVPPRSEHPCAFCFLMNWVHGFHVYLSSVKSQNRANWCKLYFSIADLRACFQLVQFFSSDWWRLTPVNITGSFSLYKTWTPEITLLIVTAVLSLPVHIILPVLFVTGSVMKPFCGKDMQKLRMHELWWNAHKSTRVCFEYLLSAFDSVCFNCAFFSRHRCTISSLGLTWKRWSMGAHWTAQASVPICPQPAWHSWD